MRLAIAITIACACSRGADGTRTGSAGSAGSSASGTDWRGDLRVLAEQLPKLHHDAFFQISEPAFRADVAKLDAAIATSTDAQITAGMMRIVALVGDAHTAIRLVGRGSYPIALYDFADGVHVIGSAPDAEWAIGATVTGVGDATLDEARRRLEPLIAHDNQYGVRSEFPLALAQPILLAGTGLAPDEKHATFQLQLADGSKRTLAVEPVLRAPYAKAPATIPLHIQRANEPYWLTTLPEHTLYVMYRQCRQGTLPIADFIDNFFATLDRDQVTRVIIDLRHNQGGDSRLFDPLINRLASRKDLRVFAIIGRQTFSSGLLNAIGLARAGAMLVGEPTAGKPSHHGEVKSFTLPSSGLVVTYSTKYFEHPGLAGDALKPALAIELTYADWAAGRDPVLDAILSR